MNDETSTDISYILQHSFLAVFFLLSKGQFLIFEGPCYPKGLSISDPVSEYLISCVHTLIHTELFQALKYLWPYQGMTEMISVAMYSSNDRPHRERETRARRIREKSKSSHVARLWTPPQTHENTHKTMYNGWFWMISSNSWDQKEMKKCHKYNAYSGKDDWRQLMSQGLKSCIAYSPCSTPSICDFWQCLSNDPALLSVVSASGKQF